MAEFVDVDPGELYLPPSRAQEVWDAEDEQLLTAARSHLEHLAASAADQASRAVAAQSDK